MEPLGIHANAVAVGGDIMLSDMTPGSSETPKEAAGITFSHAGAEKNTGELWAPGPRWRGPDVPRREPSRSPLYGQLKDKCGFRWVIISSERLWYQAQLKMF